MLRNVYLAFTFIVMMGGAAWAQTGAIKGKVIDKTTNEPLPFASVVAEINGTQAGGAQTDFDGNFTIKPLNPGTYNIKATFVGYQTGQLTGITVSVDKVTFADIKLGKGAVDITKVDIVEYKVPLIDKGNPATQATITSEEIKAIPTRDVKSVAATTAGVFQRDEGDDLNIRGSRDDATKYYIDGVKVRGNQQVPQSGIEQVTVVTGGVQAQYGDATGGIIAITTKGPSNKYSGGIEFETSELFDKYGYNLLALNASGPIWSKKKSDGTKETKLGFFISAEGSQEKDPDPSAIGVYTVNDALLADLKANPYAKSDLSNALIRRAELVRASDFENVKAKENVKQINGSFSGNLDFQPVKNIGIRLGGSVGYRKGNDYSGAIVNWWENSIYNLDNLPEITSNDYRAYLRFTQRFGSSNDKDKKSLIKNAYYYIQVDYTKNHELDQDKNHKERLWDYGYLGKYKTILRPAFLGFDINVDGAEDFWVQIDSSTIAYQPGGLNPATEAYTIQYLNFQDPNYSNNANTYFNTGNYWNFENSDGNYSTFADIQSGGGLLNGQTPPLVFSMWRNTGTPVGLYRKIENDQYRISASGSADIKNHAITIGFEYEQRIDRLWQINPNSLWTVVRNLGNENYERFPNDPSYQSLVNDTLIFTPSYSPEGTDGFYENIRRRLGLRNDEFFDVFAYDRENFSLDLFTPDELFGGNNGAASYNYYGFDYKGNKLKSTPSFDDFYQENENGIYTRKVAPFSPIYMAGYIQDNFAINDLIFNIGVRIDRFDANQKVLKDRYSLYETVKAGELKNNSVVPGNIGEDFVVYVSDVNNPAEDDIWGYRDGDTWYDKNGVEVIDPKTIEQQSPSGRIYPYLVRVSDNIRDPLSTWSPSSSFKDYEPQITVMPRVAFQFPISDQAQFYAHYSVLSQRPPARLRNNPISYYFISDGGTFNNPSLKPERSTEYELGFKQIISRSSVFSISAFYRELKDMIQFDNIERAWPAEYTTYSNQDFGTVKGFNLGYDLRRTGNVRINTSYTLQFADGTGSGDRSSVDVVSGGNPNLRAITPLDFDQRHTLKVSFDYRYGEGKDYNGPVIKNKQILSNLGVHLEFNAGSGTPYTPQRVATSEANEIGVQTQGSSKVKGSINGARLPWNYRFDLNIDKDFALNVGKKSEDRRKMYINVSFKVLNLLDTRNVISVYRYTGSPEDDGYLTSSIGISQTEIYDQLGTGDSFREQYGIKVNNPNNYALPRRIRLGVELNF